MRPSFAALALVLSLVASAHAGCAPSPTQLIVVVDTDMTVPATLDDVSVTVTSSERGTMASEHQPLSSPSGLPLTLAVVPSGDFLGPIDVRAEGSRSGTLVVARAARVTLVRGQTRMLRLDLVASCVGVPCAATESCGPDGCESLERAELEPWPGTPPRIVDAGAARDGGLDASRGPVDAFGPDVGPVDAGPVDAPSALPDAFGPDAWVGCARSSECDDGVPCTTDACVDAHCTHIPMDSLCDDGEACTDDHCTAAGCVPTPNAAACNDGVFCNGFDQCAGGSCSMHTGDPCGAPTVCDESVGRCRGCLTRADCPADTAAGWGACSYADQCSQMGARSRTTRTYACMDGACVPTDGTDTEACTRSTEGSSCGSGSCGAYGACDYTDACDETALQRRTCTDPVCVSGACMSTSRTETMPCSRSTTGTMCAATTCGAYGSCGYTDACDESATQSRTCTDHACASGSCGSAMRSETQPCTRSTTGTMCGATTCGAYGACDYTDVCDQSAVRVRTCTDRACAGGSCGSPTRMESDPCSRTTEGMSCGTSLACRSGSCVSCLPTVTGAFGTIDTTTMLRVTPSGSVLTFQASSTGMPTGNITVSGATFTGGGAVANCFGAVIATGPNTLRFYDAYAATTLDVTVAGASVTGSVAPPCLDIGPYGCIPQCLTRVSGTTNNLLLEFNYGGSGMIAFGCP